VARQDAGYEFCEVQRKGKVEGAGNRPGRRRTTDSLTRDERHEGKLLFSDARHRLYTLSVTNLQGPPLERTQTEKLRDLKKLAQHYARDRGSCDDVQLSYLETLEDHDDDNLRLAQMLAG
jgi:hypothetical protein